MAWVFTAMTGRWLGLVRIRKGRVRMHDVLPGLIVAISLHSLWNATAETLAAPLILTFWWFWIL